MWLAARVEGTFFLNVLIAPPDQALSAADRPCQGERERDGL